MGGSNRWTDSEGVPYSPLISRTENEEGLHQVALPGLPSNDNLLMTHNDKQPVVCIQLHTFGMESFMFQVTTLTFRNLGPDVGGLVSETGSSPGDLAEPAAGGEGGKSACRRVNTFCWLVLITIFLHKPPEVNACVLTNLAGLDERTLVSLQNRFYCLS